MGDWRDEPDRKERASEEGRVCESCDGAQMGRAWLLNGWAGVEEGRTGCLGAWVPGWLVQPALQEYGKKSKRGCRGRLVEGERGCAQFGSADPEGPGEGLSEMARGPGSRPGLVTPAYVGAE